MELNWNFQLEIDRGGGSYQKTFHGTGVWIIFWNNTIWAPNLEYKSGSATDFQMNSTGDETKDSHNQHEKKRMYGKQEGE